MLRAHLDASVDRVVPETDGRYIIRSESFELVDVSTGKVVISDSDGAVEITICDAVKRVLKIWVIALTYKPLFNAKSFMCKWTVMCVDGDTSNMHPSNLIWLPEAGGTPCPEAEGFYVVPGCTRNAVSKDGSVVSRAYLWRGGKNTPRTGEVKTRRSSRDNYVRCSKYDDITGKGSDTVHRLMGLALLPYTADVDDLTINHKDGQKHRNSVDNLEWATYGENNSHALDTGLRVARRAVRVYDHWENHEQLYQSISAAAQYLRKNSGYVHEVAVSSGEKLIDNRYALKFSTEMSGWRILDADILREKAARSLEVRQNRACVAIDLFTGATVVGENPGQLAKMLKLTKDQVETFLHSPSPFPHFGMTFQWLSEGPKRCDFTPEEVSAFRQYATVKNAYRVYPSDGSPYIVVGMKELLARLPRCPIHKLDKSGSSVVFERLCVARL